MMTAKGIRFATMDLETLTVKGIQLTNQYHEEKWIQYGGDRAASLKLCPADEVRSPLRSSTDEWNKAYAQELTLTLQMKIFLNQLCGVWSTQSVWVKNADWKFLQTIYLKQFANYRELMHASRDSFWPWTTPNICRTRSWVDTNAKFLVFHLGDDQAPKTVHSPFYRVIYRKNASEQATNDNAYHILKLNVLMEECNSRAQAHRIHPSVHDWLNSCFQVTVIVHDTVVSFTNKSLLCCIGG